MRLRLIGGVAAMLFACMPALATPVSISPGETVTPGTGTYGGTLINTLTHSGAGGSLTYTDSVYADPNNPICSGCYDFVLSVTDSDFFTVVQSATSADFHGNKYKLQVAYEDDGNVAPDSVTEGPGGSKITFNTTLFFLEPTSDPLIIYTNALNYTSGDITFTTTGLEVDPPGYAPSGPASTGVTPEPSSLMLLGTGVLGLAGMMRRRLA